MSIPCPKCRRPNQIEARICTCGHWFVRQPELIQAGHFPDIQTVLPELRKNLPRLRAVPRLHNVERSESTELQLLRSELTHENFLEPDIQESRGFESNPIDWLEDESKPNIWPTFVSAGILLLCALLTAYWVWSFAFIDDSNVRIEAVSLSQADSSVETEAPVETTRIVLTEQEENINPAADRSQKIIRPKPSRISSPGTGLPLAPNGNNIDETETLPINTPEQQHHLQSSSPGSTESNVEANIEKDPAASANSAVAVARCADGTFSYSKSGTCAYRGGVAAWLDGQKTTAKTIKAERTYILGSRGGCYYLNTAGSKMYVDKALCN